MEVRTDNIVDNYQCGDYIFNSNFDSGNLGKVEFVRSFCDHEIENNIHSEYNVWTSPDCYGTANESPNRTWFFFSIKGGKPHRNVKINVKNLNRQAKLFNQGMQPVMRIGQKGKWERIKDKPTYIMEMENFCISFIHCSLEQPNVEYYYAFTYPFTYADCQNFLENLDKKYQKSDHDMNYIFYRILSIKQTGAYVEGNNKRSMSVTYSPKEAEKIQNFTNYNETDRSVYEQYSQEELLSEIYYHRELLIKSLENRRVDLITITSFHGIQEKFENRLDDLFPNQQENRCRCFKNKKIIFLSSRVHPGETPASFVLNGFINLLLDKKSIIASTLRQLYVFKIVPILNPDGVFRGFYRTDTLGQNLNRMYTNPKLDIHPSIYAVKKLIKYYHHGFQSCIENSNNDNIVLETNLGIEKINSSFASSENDKYNAKMEFIKTEDSENKNEILIKTEENCTDFCKDNLKTSDGEENKRLNLSSNTKARRIVDKPKVLIEKSVSEIKIIRESSNRKILEYPNINKNNVVHTLRKNTTKTNLSFTHNLNIRNTSQKKKIQQLKIQPRSSAKKVIQQKGLNCTISLTTSNKHTNNKNALSYCNVNSSISLRNEGRCSIRTVEDKSNIFLYIDFHGHASKKGIFMYGNYFPDSVEAVECMMLPRLMSINCHHFHYDACNFSEKNMYKREKRDGLSKEGSGRVAVFKMTGLIKSYTLESNYNTGKYVNILPGRGKSNTSKVGNLTPPRYTPTIYEEVGRSLGPSILDLTNSNCLSRIYNSEFHTLQGLRITLQSEIERGFLQQSTLCTTKKVLGAHQNLKRKKINSQPALSTLSSIDTTKENKTLCSMQWRSGLALSNFASSSQSKIQQKSKQSDKKVSLRVRAETLFGKKEYMQLMKKSKIYAEHCISNKHEPSFQVPTKKVRVASKATQYVTTPKTDSQIPQNFANKANFLLNCNTYIKTNNVEKDNSIDQILKEDSIIIDNYQSNIDLIKTNTKEDVLQEKSLESEFHELDLAPNASVAFWKNSTCSSSDVVIKSRIMDSESEAMPAYSCTTMSPSAEVSNSMKCGHKYATCFNHTSFDKNTKVNSFGNNDCSKLQKKCVLQQQAVKIKRKKSQI